MRAMAALLLMTLTLGACAQINRPITPDEEWRERGTRTTNSLPAY